MRLETLAVSKLMERMVGDGASLEELKKVADYMVTAAVYDENDGCGCIRDRLIRRCSGRCCWRIHSCLRKGRKRH